MKFNPADGNAAIDMRAEELLGDDLRKIHCGTDRLFAGLMVLQWIRHCSTSTLASFSVEKISPLSSPSRSLPLKLPS